MEISLYTKEEIDQKIEAEIKPLREKIIQLEKIAKASLTGFASTKRICEELDIDRATLISWRDKYELPAHSPTGKKIFWEIDIITNFIKTGKVA